VLVENGYRPKRLASAIIDSVAVPILFRATRSDSNDNRTIVSTYREFTPDLISQPGIVCTWEGNAGWARPLRVLPDGCVDVVWSGTKVRVVRPHSAATWHRLDDDTHTVGVRLRPGWAATVLGVPISALADVTDLEDIWTRAAAGRTEALLAETQPQSGRRQVLIELVDRRLLTIDPPDYTVLAVLELLDHARVSVEAVAVHVGLSVRQLRRRFHDHVGLTPKAFQTVARFQRFRRYISESVEATTLARAAAACGYADQAHLAHECRRLASTTPAYLSSHPVNTQRPVTRPRPRISIQFNREMPSELLED
jgi:AraC-like DNA-binding protein